LKNPKEKRPRGEFVKRGKVWRSDKAQETARAKPKSGYKGRQDGPARSRPPAKDEDSRLRARALASTGPGGYAKFSDIPAHKSGRNLRGLLYKLANELPEEERHNLTSRIKHAATTITASLAAGFGEGTFRAGTTRALESRGALHTVQDLLDQVSEQQMAGTQTLEQLKKEVEQTIKAVNEYLGRLAKEREKVSC